MDKIELEIDVLLKNKVGEMSCPATINSEEINIIKLLFDLSEKWPNQLNSFHQYRIISSKIGNKLKILAITDENTVEAVSYKEYKQWRIMWNPEKKPFDPQYLKIIKKIFNEK